MLFKKKKTGYKLKKKKNFIEQNIEYKIINYFEIKIKLYYYKRIISLVYLDIKFFLITYKR
jgi:hypothetical protein